MRLLGEFPPVAVDYAISVASFHWLYYLTDGTYPSCNIFAKELSAPRNAKDRTYCRRQEALKNCVGRLFSILFKQIRILTRSGRLWKSKDLTTIIQASVVLHKMMVEERRDEV